MHTRVNGFDWSRTPLGALEEWPQSLRATITILLGSRYPMILLWGPELIQIYNEAYIGLIGDKHPGALGRSIRETQAESWDTIGPMIQEVMSSGVPNWVPAQCLPLERYGYREESYFSLSYSAVEDDAGSISGMLCVCSEVTDQVLGERRLELLRELAVKAGETPSADAACAQIAAAIAEHSLDVPFAALYLESEDGRSLLLRGSSGVSRLGSLPERIELPPEEDSDAQGRRAPLGTPDGLAAAIERAMAGETSVLEGLYPSFGVTGGPWKGPVDGALVLPLEGTGQRRSMGVLLAGKTPNRALDATYRSFYQLLAAQASAAIRNARAREDERKRAEALAELDRAKTMFFSNISHEFRTPLTLILGPIEHALRGASRALAGDELEAVHRSSLRLLRLVNSLLDFSRLEAGKLQTKFEPTDLAAFTCDLASSFRSLIERAGLALVVECAPLSRAVAVDREKWEKIVLNLLSNAFKFTFEGTIRVSLAERGENVELSVGDTGTGIPAHELPHIFERFRRVEGARGRSFEGTGIGLSMVSDLVHLHSGSVSVSSVEGRGSTFTVSIPATLEASADERSGEPESASKSAYVLEAAQWFGAGPSREADAPGVVMAPALGAAGGLVEPDVHVLVADDNADMRNYLARLLGERWHVVAVADGGAALSAARERKPDLVLADVMMPVLDGFGLLRELRKDPATRAVPVILLSARAGEEAVLEGLDYGADDYLVKPFSARELFARLTTLLALSRLRRAAAEAEERARHASMLRFLADASATLAESLDYRTTLARVAQLTVPILADWCFIDIVESNGAIARVEVAHADPNDHELAAALKAFPAAASDNRDNPPTRALLEGKSVLLAEVPVEALGSMSHGAEHVAVMRALGPRSLIAVPLFARGRILGSLTMLTSSSGRHYGPVDLTVAEDLARRCALAVDNAKLYDRAQRAIVARDHFLSIASHELRTPLTPIQLSLHTLERKVDDVAKNMHAAEWLNDKFVVLRRQSERLDRLATELLDASLIDEGGLALHPEWMNLTLLTREVIRRFEASGEIRRSGSSIQLQAEREIWGKWDRSRLEQVLTNLIENALKFGHGRPIDVALRVSGSSVQLEISDQGLGIPPADQARVFERFERAVSERSYGGLGLGLWLVRRILDAMGGRISVASVPGRGSTFSVELPTLETRAQALAPAGSGEMSV